jgi:iron complex transport system ATP-binding protein
MLTDRPQTDHLKVLDLVLLGRFPYRKGFGKLSQEDIKIAKQALEQVQAPHLCQRKVDTLSDGERQRVLLARALTQAPQLLALDEPTSFLDYPHKVETFHFLKKWTQAQQRSVVMSTHDLDLSLSLADRIILLQPGSPIIEGAPEDLVLNGHLEKVFHTEHLSIDHHSGKFKVKLETKFPIKLIGEGEIFCWTEKALNRSGFYLDEQATHSIRVFDQKWVYTHQDCEKNFSNLYEIMQFLKNQTPF